MIPAETTGPQGTDYDKWRVQAAQVRQRWLVLGGLGNSVPQLAADEQRLWDELRTFFLDVVFHRKCAFCEVGEGNLMPLVVIPYRPLAGVTDQQVPVPGHPGYYWLAFEWFNLLLSCSFCAEKANEFPVSGKRMHTPVGSPGRWQRHLALEGPLLVSPYDPWPQNGHFGFHVQEGDEIDGHIFGLTAEARETIRVCKLDRLTLVAARRAARTRALARLSRGIHHDGTLRTFGPERPFSAWLNFVQAVEARRRASR